jgi:hypothetical protein
MRAHDPPSLRKEAPQLFGNSLRRTSIVCRQMACPRNYDTARARKHGAESIDCSDQITDAPGAAEKQCFDLHLPEAIKPAGHFRDQHAVVASLE